MTRVLFAAAEAAPFYKTGGLGDVSMALPRALRGRNRDACSDSVLPSPDADRISAAVSASDAFYCSSGEHAMYCGIKTLTVAHVQYYLIDNLDYFGREDYMVIGMMVHALPSSDGGL